MLHIFICDFNNEGHMYRVTVEGEREEILSFLQQYSNDVRYVKSKDKGKKDKGIRRIPCGIITGCTYYYDKINTFKRVPKNLPVDERHLYFKEVE